MAYQLHSLPRDERSDEHASSTAYPKNLALHHSPAPTGLPHGLIGVTSSNATSASASTSTGSTAVERVEQTAGSAVPIGRMSPSVSSNVEFGSPREAPTSKTDRHVVPHGLLHSRQSGYHKSQPIAIARSNTAGSTRSGIATTYETDDDLEETSTVTATVSKLHQSLPSRLLRAPFLGSIPNMERNLMPPPMRLSDPDDTYDHVDDPTTGALDDTSWRNVNYGSLRESHRQGRFLDGPLGFFNERRRTGAIVVPADSYNWNSRNNSALLSSSAPVPQPGLSIGERIQQQRKLQQIPRSKVRTGGALSTSLGIGPTAEEEAEHSNQQISTLAALIEATTVSEYNSDGEPFIVPSLDLLHVAELSDTVANTNPDRTEHAALSSSLTGLQVLKHGLPPMCGMVSSGLDTLPLTENMAIFEPLTFLSGSICSKTNATVATSQSHMTIDDYSVTLPTSLDLGTDRDPDTDGAFDFDME